LLLVIDPHRGPDHIPVGSIECARIKVIKKDDTITGGLGLGVWNEKQRTSKEEKEEFFHQ
jgi:hypothetical protein